MTISRDIDNAYDKGRKKWGGLAEKAGKGTCYSSQREGSCYRRGKLFFFFLFILATMTDIGA